MTCCSCMAVALIGVINLVILVVMGVVAYFCLDIIKQVTISEVKSSKTFLFSAAVIGVIALTCIIGFFMLCCYKNQCFRTTYAVLYFIIVVAECALLYFIYKTYPTLLHDLDTWWDKNKGSVEVKKVESSLECCGFIKEYNETEMMNCGYTSNSSSTDTNSSENKTANAETNTTETNSTDSTIETCYNKVNDKLAKSKKGLMIAGIGIAAVQIILLIYSLWFGCCYKPHKKDESSSSYSSSSYS